MLNWSGHGHEYQPWLRPDGYWLLVPISGTCRGGPAEEVVEAG